MLRFVASLLVLGLLSGCGGNAEDSQTSAESSAQRAEEIHDAIFAVLDQRYPNEKDALWSSAPMDLNGDWVVESPEGLWGLDADQLPKELDCNKKKAGCNADFLRMSCMSDTDCTTVGTRCSPLKATVFRPDQEAQNLCLGPSDALIDRFYEVMVSAEKELDIVSLSMPDGRFRVAMNHALALLSHKTNPPALRLLFSGYNAGLPNFLNPPGLVLKRIMDDVAKLSASAKSLRVNLAWLADGKLSWNHVKIIAADGQRALSGGHNMWDKDYLRPTPVSDLSLEFSGEAAEKARDFANALWEQVDDFASYGGAERLGPFREKAQSHGGVPAIHVGRLGVFGANPADDAIIALIDAAQGSLLIDQQDYYNYLITKSPLTRTFAFDAIINAALRGVTVQMIQSNKYPFGNYGMIEPKEAYKSFINELSKRFVKEQGLREDEARALACKRMAYAPFQVSGHLKGWPNNRGNFATHSKLILVDDAAAYVGSQNLYPANLQEYGSIITDAAATAHLKDVYWDKAWHESSQTQLECPR